MTATKPSLAGLPQDLLLDALFPVLPIRDLLALGSTNHFFHSLTSEEVFWKRKCEQDFNFSGARTARKTGWKAIYKGLSHPKVFVWGTASRGRMGLPQRDLGRASVRGGIPYPVQLKIPGARIVDLIAGGWSFHALDSEGRLFVWGTLDGSSYSPSSAGFSSAKKEAETPHLLRLPEKIKSVSCGRKHVLALDIKGGVWTFFNWGRPYLTISPLLNNTSPETSVIQVECGWTFCAVLTESGDVLMWWPFGDDLEWLRTTMQHMDQQGERTMAKAVQEGDMNVIPCAVWRHGFDPARVPAIPVGTLPELTHSSEESAQSPGETHGIGIRLVKIAAMEDSLVGLTNKGHVLVLHGLGSEQALGGVRWEYLPLFSESERVREHEIFAQPGPDGATTAPPTDVHITHISANFRSFSAYSVSSSSSSTVLTGSSSTFATNPPTILPSLQNRSIISVVLGDYHSAALTSDGRLFAWGAYSHGALGLGDPGILREGSPGAYVARTRQVDDVRVPTEVGFGRDGRIKERKERFMFGVAAAGWHTGALVYDLDGAEDDPEDNLPTPTNSDDEDDHDRLGLPLPHIPIHPHPPGGMPIVPLPLRGRRGGGRAIPFVRVGFAGRGANRGVRGRGGGGGGDGAGEQGGQGGGGAPV